MFINQLMHVAGGNSLGGGQNLPVQSLRRSKSLVLSCNLQVNDSVGKKPSNNFRLGALPPCPL